MTDKEKIKAEIERYKKLIGDPILNDNDLIIGERNAINHVLKLIDSLPEESVSVWHDASNEYPFPGKEIIVLRDNKIYYGKYIGGFHRYVRAEIQLTDDTAQTYAIIDYLAEKDKWIYVEDLLKLANFAKTCNNWKEPVSEDLEEAAVNYAEQFMKEVDNVEIEQAKWRNRHPEEPVVHGGIKACFLFQRDAFKAGAKWHKENLWKPADGDDLPEIDREVIAIIDYDFGHYKVVYAHRPNPNGWNGTNIDTGEEKHFEPVIYDKGDWNQPHVLYWLDAKLPYEENKINKEIEL